MGSVSPFSATKAKSLTLTAALLPAGTRTAPASVNFTLTGGVAKGATTAPVTSVTTTAQTGQALNFVSAGVYYLAILSANYTTGTSLSIQAAAEAIPSGAVAAFPAQCRLRTTADLNFTIATQDVDTYDHVVTEKTPGASTGTFQLNGLYSHWDAGYHTMRYASDNALEIYFARTLPIPSNAFATGRVTGFAALVTTRSDAAPNGGFVSADFQLSVQGTLNDALPVPT